MERGGVRQTFTTDPRCSRKVRAFVTRCLDRAGASDATAFEILVATTEAVANVVKHARSSRSFEVSCDTEGRSVVVTVRDRGPGIRHEGDLGRDPGVEQTRGRGLFLIRELMDVVVVDSSEEGTTVAMKRRLLTA